MEKIGGKDGVGMPGLSNVKVARGSLQRQMEKPGKGKEKQMNRIKKPDRGNDPEKQRGGEDLEKPWFPQPRFRNGMAIPLWLSRQLGKTRQAIHLQRFPFSNSWHSSCTWSWQKSRQGRETSWSVQTPDQAQFASLFSPKGSTSNCLPELPRWPCGDPWGNSRHPFLPKSKDWPTRKRVAATSRRI